MHTPRAPSARRDHQTSLATRAAVASFAIATSAPATAHETTGFQWSFDPWIVVPLVMAALLYARGVTSLWRHAGGRRGVSPLNVASFGAGWLVSAAALASPLDDLASRLFSAHMVQHELLMVIAAPLFVLGRPLAVWAWALPPRQRPQLALVQRAGPVALSWRLISRPVSAWLLHTAVIWAWHAPALFEAALHSPTIHTIQHLSFLGTALLFWWNALAATSQLARGTAVLGLFTTMVHTGVLGALLTFSGTALYPTYAATAAAAGVDALVDQQLGGVLMWVPGGLSYLAGGLFIAAGWLQPYRPRRA